MKHKTEALAAFALMYILSEYEVDQELKDKVSALFTEVHSLTEDNDEGNEEPSVYDRPLGVVYKDQWGGWMKEDYETVVHFADGTMKWYHADNTENTNP